VARRDGELPRHRAGVDPGGVVVATTVLADAAPDVETTVFFERAHQPVHGEVDFSVHCFGYAEETLGGGPQKPSAVGSRGPVEVFSYAAKCPDYGCKIHPLIYLKFLHIDGCSGLGSLR
jgi:hypothetical protein